MPDGRLIRWDKDLEASFTENVRAFRPAHQDLLAKNKDRPIPPEGLRELYEITPVISRSMEVWAADISSVIDEIERLSANGRLGDLGAIIDPSKIAAAGMSFGGAASAQAAFSDDRIRAVVNLDGFHYCDALLGERVRVPYLLFSSATGTRWRNQYVLEDTMASTYWVVPAEAKHFDFSDFIFLGQAFRWLGALGPIGDVRMPAVISAFVVLFLDGVFNQLGDEFFVPAAEAWPEAQVTAYPQKVGPDSLR